MLPTSSQPPEPYLGMARTTSSPSCQPPCLSQVARLAASCLMYLTAPSPRCPPSYLWSSPFKFSQSDTFPLFPPLGCLYALPYSFSLTASPGLFCQVFLQNKLLYKLVYLSLPVEVVAEGQGPV